MEEFIITEHWEGCETVGDIYFLLILEGSSLGRITVLNLFHTVVSTLMPCKLAIEVEKAYIISKGLKE